MVRELLAVEPRRPHPPGACCHVMELRQYTLHPDQRETFIELFDSTFADPLDATGMTVIGQFRDLDRPDRFVWMRGFKDMRSRARELAAFYDGALWRAHRDEANACIVDSDNVLLLENASPEFVFKNIAPRPRANAIAPVGLVLISLYYTQYTTARSPGAFATLFDRSLRRHTEEAGARTLAMYTTSRQENNFPRLPVRVGEHIFVWVPQFTNIDAYAAYEEKLAANAKWRHTLWPTARSRLSRDPEVLRLTPTSRSRLRGKRWIHRPE